MEDVTRFVITASGSPRAVPPNGSTSVAFQRSSAPELGLEKPLPPAPAPEKSASKTFLRATYILAASAVLLLLATLGNLATKFL